MNVTSIVDDLPPVYEKFYATTDQERTCTSCGTLHPARDFQTWHQVLEANHRFNTDGSRA